MILMHVLMFFAQPLVLFSFVLYSFRFQWLEREQPAPEPICPAKKAVSNGMFSGWAGSQAMAGFLLLGRPLWTSLWCALTIWWLTTHGCIFPRTGTFLKKNTTLGKQIATAKASPALSWRSALCPGDSCNTIQIHTAYTSAKNLWEKASKTPKKTRRIDK